MNESPIGTVWFTHTAVNMIVKTGDNEFKAILPQTTKLDFLATTFVTAWTEDLLDWAWQDGRYDKQYDGRWIKP